MVSESDIPDFLQEEPPKGRTSYVKWALMHGKTEEELISESYNLGVIRVAAAELEKAGFRKRPRREVKHG